MRGSLVAAAASLAVLAVSPAVVAADPAASATDTPHFVTLDRITTPIMGASRIEGELDLSVVLEASNAGAAQSMNARMPELRAASLAATLEFSRLYASGLTPVDAERLSTDLTTALKHVDPGLSRVLIVKVSATPA